VTPPGAKAGDGLAGQRFEALAGRGQFLAALGGVEVGEQFV